ncbi:hypothetical protein [Okeania sp. KiyG1]|nr:hypothetical protein [Okeania sp. KiyG1]
MVVFCLEKFFSLRAIALVTSPEGKSDRSLNVVGFGGAIILV